MEVLVFESGSNANNPVTASTDDSRIETDAGSSEVLEEIKVARINAEMHAMRG